MLAGAQQPGRPHPDAWRIADCVLLCAPGSSARPLYLSLRFIPTDLVLLSARGTDDAARHLS